jgi:hypothetical protein
MTPSRIAWVVSLALAPLAPCSAAGDPPPATQAPPDPAALKGEGAPAPVAPAAAAPAAQPEGLEQLRSTLLNLVRALVEQKVLTPEKAQALLRESGVDPALLGSAVPAPPATAPQATEPTPPVVKVPYVPQTVRDQIRDEVKQEVLSQARAERWGEPGALPEWLNRFTLYGDVKIRFQSDRYDSGDDLVQIIDAAFGQPQGNTLDSTEARDRFRVRGRLGVEAKPSDTVQAGFRIVTNGPNEDPYNPTSEYFDVGQYGQRYGAQVDLAYIRWSALPWLSWSGGRVANPYFATDLVWATDFTFDGTQVRLRPRLTESWSSYTTLGAYYLESTSTAPGTASNNAWMYAAQTGAEAEWTDHSTLNLGAAYYYFENLEGKLNPALPVGNNIFANTAVPFRKPGNTTFNIDFLSNPNGSPVYALASRFRLLDLIGRYELGTFEPMKIGLTGEFVRNLGFDSQEIGRRIGLAALALPQDRTGATALQRPRVIGYLAELKVGARDIVRRGDWQAFGGYRLLERDATVAEFTSADYRLGGTDQRSEYFGFGYGLANNTSLLARYVTAKSLDLAPRYNIDTWLIDVQTKF